MLKMFETSSSDRWLVRCGAVSLVGNLKRHFKCGILSSDSWHQRVDLQEIQLSIFICPARDICLSRHMKYSGGVQLDYCCMTLRLGPSAALQTSVWCVGIKLLRTGYKVDPERESGFLKLRDAYSRILGQKREWDPILATPGLGAQTQKF